MKRLVFVLGLVGLFIGHLFAETRFYIPLSVQDLPAGSTIQVVIRGTGVFTVGGSTTTSHTSTFVIPRTHRIGTFTVGVSSANVFTIIHGEKILR